MWAQCGVKIVFLISSISVSLPIQMQKRGVNSAYDLKFISSFVQKKQRAGIVTAFLKWPDFWAATCLLAGILELWTLKKHINQKWTVAKTNRRHLLRHIKQKCNLSLEKKEVRAAWIMHSNISSSRIHTTFWVDFLLNKNIGQAVKQAKVIACHFFNTHSRLRKLLLYLSSHRIECAFFPRLKVLWFDKEPPVIKIRKLTSLAFHSPKRMCFFCSTRISLILHIPS